MSYQASTQTIVDFVNVALSQRERSGICDILGEIAKATNAYGAILWEADPDIPLDSKDARLFTAGHWLRSDKRLAAHDLSVKKSLAGTAIRENQLVVTNNMLEDVRSAKTEESRQFCLDHNVTRCQAAPVQFSDGRKGSISLFRAADGEDFRGDDGPLFLQFCQLLPGLHDSLHHTVSFGLVDKVKDILRQAEDASEGTIRVWTELCKAVQNCFHLIEVSIFLEDPMRRPGVFHLEHTSCQDYISTTDYTAEHFGLTSWAIQHRRSVLIWDLRYQNRKKEQSLMTNLYEGVQWKDPKGIEGLTAKQLQMKKEELPPLSFIAEPIFSGEKVYGALRCCGAKAAPYYFTNRERALFAVVASQIGQFWAKWLDRRTIHDENKAWNKLVRITDLNNSANSEVRKPNSTIRSVLEQGLHATADMIPGAEIVDIRLVDEAGKNLYVAFTHGGDWTDQLKGMTFSLQQNARDSPGVQVFQTGKALEIDVQAHREYRSVFPNVKALLIVPIRSSNCNYGVIDIRSTEAPHFPLYAVQMAELLGQQLGLYYELFATVGELRAKEEELKKQTTITNDAFADWQHQIRGPISQAYYRLRETIREDFPDYDDVPQHFQFQIGLLRKARQASQSLQLFQHLSKGDSLKARPQAITAADLRKLLIETCLDNQLLSSQRRAVSFYVKANSFKNLEGRPLSADLDLLQQALNNIIDNAFKYSYSKTVIDISGVVEAPFFAIVVNNAGITLPASDVENVAHRGWRAEQALAVVGEGAGIGLWVVDHIMKAHGGRLEVVPTAQRRTTVKLLFPWK